MVTNELIDEYVDELNDHDDLNAFNEYESEAESISDEEASESESDDDD
jgi:hypothetical protein